MRTRQLIALSLSLAAGAALAQGYPNKVIKLQVPFAPGGTTDIIARTIADPLGKALGQSVIVENKAGGGGVVGANETAKATPDGYSLGMATVSTVAANPAINPKNPYNPLTDFTPIINVAATPNVIAVHPGFPAKDFKGFLAELKGNPGKHSYATSGTGGIGHLQMELFKNLTTTFVTHIPYRGAGPALNDVVAGQVPMTFDNMPSAMPFITSNRLIPIVVAAPQRLAQLPNVPTFKEEAVSDLVVVGWYGMFAPAKTPQAIVDRLSQEIAAIVRSPEITNYMKESALVPTGLTASEFSTKLPYFRESFSRMIKENNIRIE